MITQAINRIHRPRLIELSFSTKEALNNEADRAIRMVNLERAMRRGVNERLPVSLQFQLSDGSIGETQATVWGIDGDKLELKGGKILPISAISNIEF